MVPIYQVFFESAVYMKVRAFLSNRTEVIRQVKVSLWNCFSLRIRELTIDTSDLIRPYRRCHQSIEGKPSDYTRGAIRIYRRCHFVASSLTLSEPRKPGWIGCDVSVRGWECPISDTSTRWEWENVREGRRRTRWRSKVAADILDRRGLEGQQSNARAAELELIAPVKGLEEVEQHNQSWSR